MDKRLTAVRKDRNMVRRNNLQFIGQYPIVAVRRDRVLDMRYKQVCKLEHSFGIFGLDAM